MRESQRREGARTCICMHSHSCLPALSPVSVCFLRAAWVMVCAVSSEYLVGDYVPPCTCCSFTFPFNSLHYLGCINNVCRLISLKLMRCLLLAKKLVESKKTTFLFFPCSLSRSKKKKKSGQGLGMWLHGRMFA
jgi:hypothetical protein